MAAWPSSRAWSRVGRPPAPLIWTASPECSTTGGIHSIPALIFGLLLTAYWGRVVRLVYKMRRRHGASANFAPPERLGKALRLVWVPAVVVWIAHPYVTALAPPQALPGPLRGALRPLYSNDVVGYLAAAVGAAALAGTLVCWKRMGKSWRMGINPDEKTQLIVSGPYAYVRHPIYALQSVLALATAAAVPSPLMLGVAAAIVLLLLWEARREEKYLLVHHGEAYGRYCRRVGRFVPRSAAPFEDSPVPQGDAVAERTLTAR